MKARWDSKNHKVPRNIPEASHVLVVTLPIPIITLGKFGQFSSVIQSCVTLWDPIDCSLPGFPVHHQLLELIQTHVPWVGDATQPSHPLSSSAPPAFKLSELIKWVDSLHQVAKVLELLYSESVHPMNIQGWFSEGWLVSSACSPRHSQEYSPIPQFKSINSLALSFLYGPTLTSVYDYWKSHSFH